MNTWATEPLRTRDELYDLFATIVRRTMNPTRNCSGYSMLLSLVLKLMCYFFNLEELRWICYVVM